MMLYLYIISALLYCRAEVFVEIVQKVQDYATDRLLEYAIPLTIETVSNAVLQKKKTDIFS